MPQLRLQRRSTIAQNGLHARHAAAIIKERREEERKKGRRRERARSSSLPRARSVASYLRRPARSRGEGEGLPATPAPPRNIRADNLARISPEPARFGSRANHDWNAQ